jgi:hypothetical protein
MMKEKRYISFDPAEGYPTGTDLSYECLNCGESVSSLPSGNTGCRCGNIFIDVDYGRMAVEDDAKIRLFSSK